MKTIEESISLPGTVVVDVRTPQEYENGHLANSINIPLNELPLRIDELKQMKNIVVCCASGVRSQKAAQYLKQNDIPCSDGGSWSNLNACSTY